MYYNKNVQHVSFKVIISLVLFLLIAIWFGPGPGSAPATIIFRRGATVGTVANQLRHNGVIRSVVLFRLWARVSRFRPIRGEYVFKSRANMYSVTTKLKAGDINYTSVSVPPGCNAWNIQRRFSEFIPEKIFWSLWQDPRFMCIAGFPDAKNMEGLVAPLVYRLNRAQDPEEIFLYLAETFRDRVRPTLDGGHLSPYKILTLASMIEKETSVEEELPLIAGVYSKRIRLGMKLQCDPTVLYARWNSGDLRFSGPNKVDLCRKSNFNTYSVSGLPPTPIASPSKNAIAAAKLPYIGSNIYFAATGKGGHAFAASLSEHSQNVKQYRNELARRLSNQTR
jgi:UPF0755 protein